MTESLLALILFSTIVAISTSAIGHTTDDRPPDRQNASISGEAGHTREKRLIAYNFDERRITFPPGTILFLTPTLDFPFIRNLAKGYKSVMRITAPFQINFDDFDLTDEYNPWGIIPGISIPQDLQDGAGNAARRKRRYRRWVNDYSPHPLGDRVMLFEAIEGHLEHLGHDGRACLLRVICETNEQPLPYHGLFGELLELLFRVSVTPLADEMLSHYVQAEKSGSERSDCRHYHQDCPFSIFTTVS